MPRFPWLDEYSVKDEGVDGQHQHLLELANLLIEAFETGKSEAVAKDAMTALEEYARVHFADEENYMIELEVPKLREHRQMHASLLLDLEGLRYQLTARLPGFEKNLIKWVVNCLVPHMQGADMEAMRYIAHARSDEDQVLVKEATG